MTDQQTLILRAKILGALLRKARMTARMSLKEMGALINTTSGVVSSYEHGRKGISLPELEILAYHLDIPIEHFISDASLASEKRAVIHATTLIALRQRMIGALLRQRRTELDLSFNALGQASGISARRISAYERGERPIPLPELEALTAALDQSLDDYLDAEGPVGEWLADEAAFEQFKQLPKELRDFLSKPGNEPYIELAKRMSETPVDKLRSLADALIDLTV
jgi:transcriptional regulator with XRE-family HTH domain